MEGWLADAQTLPRALAGWRGIGEKNPASGFCPLKARAFYSALNARARILYAIPLNEMSAANAAPAADTKTR